MLRKQLSTFGSTCRLDRIPNFARTCGEEVAYTYEVMQVFLFALGSLLLGGCGPSELEAGQAVLLTAPVITLIGAGMVAIYCRQWRPLASDLTFAWRPSLYVVAAQISLAAIAVLTVGSSLRSQDDWFFTIICLVGPSYLTLQLLTIRLAVMRRLRRHYSRLSLLPWAILYPHAILLGFWGSNSSEVGEFPALLWTLPGYIGVTTVLLLFILGIELAVRRYQLAKSTRKPPYPAPLPKAQAKIK